MDLGFGTFLAVWILTSSLTVRAILTRQRLRGALKVVWLCLGVLPIIGPLMYIVWRSDDPGPHGGDNIGSFDATTHQIDL